MGKQGPCRHCGVTSTPLWRNGPPEKPVLCNACGSRWRTKGSLTNYTPLHARELLDPEEFKVSKVRSICFKAKDSQPHKKKQNNDIVESEHEMPYSDQNFRKIFDGDTSNRSSSGSAISYSESCAYFGNTDASDLTGSAQSNVWDSLVPSKKRTCVARPKPSPVEKLTKDLHSILHEQQSSYLSGSSHEDLLYESATPIGSAEIGHGGVLLRYPNSKTIEEESEASSLPTDTKSYLINESYSGPTSFLVHTESEGTSFSNAGIENFKKPTSQVAQGHVKRDKVSHEKLNILQGRDSPLTSTDLTKSKWVEHCKNLKDVKQKQITGGKTIATGPCSLGYSNLTPLKRPRYSQIQYDQAEKGTMRSPKRVSKSGDMNLSSTKSSLLNCDDADSKIIQDTDDFIDSEGACFSPRSIFASPPDRSSMMVSLQFTDESSDQDLLLDVPSNASFPEAELLLNPLIRMTAPNSSPAESGAAEGEESLSNKPSSSFSNQHQRHR